MKMTEVVAIYDKLNALRDMLLRDIANCLLRIDNKAELGEVLSLCVDEPASYGKTTSVKIDALVYDSANDTLTFLHKNKTVFSSPVKDTDETFHVDSLIMIVERLSDFLEEVDAENAINQ